MNTTRRIALGAAGCAVATALAGASVAGLTAASGAAAPTAAKSQAPKTLVFTSITKSDTSPTKNTLIQHSVDRAHGKVIGFDVITVRFSPKNDKDRIYATFSLVGGQVFTRLRFADEGAVGRIIGGSGKFAGITGTVAAEAISQNGKRSRVTLTYQHD